MSDNLDLVISRWYSVILSMKFSLLLDLQLTLNEDTKNFMTLSFSKGSSGLDSRSTGIRLSGFMFISCVVGIKIWKRNSFKGSLRWCRIDKSFSVTLSLFSVKDSEDCIYHFNSYLVWLVIVLFLDSFIFPLYQKILCTSSKLHCVQFYCYLYYIVEMVLIL